MITKKQISVTPSQYGVYIFYKNSIPIYVGKAINIKARLLSHLTNSRFDEKERLIMSEANQIKTIVLNSDFSAILKEAELIKTYNPKYNLALKDDKSLLYIGITIKEKYPKIFLARGRDARHDNRSLFFGPFKSRLVASEILRDIRRIIPFCTQRRLSRRACFYSKIGQCDPCPNIISTHFDKESFKKYQTNIRRVIKIMHGQTELVSKLMRAEMEKYVRAEKYEEALKIRNKIYHLDGLGSLKHYSEYESKKPLSPKKLNMQLSNLINKYFGPPAILKKTNIRVECFDVSNLFGRQATASMTVFVDGVPVTGQYRRFKIKTIKKISDVDMLKEVINRRLRQNWTPPALIVIDGGRPQVAAARKALEVAAVNIPLIGIAKKPDRIIIKDSLLTKTEISQNKDFFTLICAIRDESHRFAKKYHLSLRKKKLMI